jgi:hypothetical protein
MRRVEGGSYEASSSSPIFGGLLFRQCEDDSSYSNEDTKSKEGRKGWVADRRPNMVPDAKPAPCRRTAPQHLHGSGTKGLAPDLNGLSVAVVLGHIPQQILLAKCQTDE